MIDVIQKAIIGEKIFFILRIPFYGKNIQTFDLTKETNLIVDVSRFYTYFTIRQNESNN